MPGAVALIVGSLVVSVDATGIIVFPSIAFSPVVTVFAIASTSTASLPSLDISKIFPSIVSSFITFGLSIADPTLPMNSVPLYAPTVPSAAFNSFTTSVVLLALETSFNGTPIPTVNGKNNAAFQVSFGVSGSVTTASASAST